MARFIVWHTTGKFDGDSSHSTLASAKLEFDHQRSRPNVTQVELSECSDDESFVIQSWDAVDVGDNGDVDPNTL